MGFEADVLILRGISGSGKSTFAASIEEQVSAVVFSTDSCFMKNGKYEFKPELLSFAHSRCLNLFTEAVRDMSMLLTQMSKLDKDRRPKLIVDNTNCSIAEIAPYYAISEAYGLKPVIVEMVPRASYENPDVVINFAKRNIHSVPVNTVARQARTLVESRLPIWWDHQFPGSFLDTEKCPKSTKCSVIDDDLRIAAASKPEPVFKGGIKAPPKPDFGWSND